VIGTGLGSTMVLSPATLIVPLVVAARVPLIGPLDALV